MEEAKILTVKEMLYKKDSREILNFISQTNDTKILYIFAYNYNWENGFDIPAAIINNLACNLSIALLIFYRADGFSYLQNKADNLNLPQWSFFIKLLYESIMNGKYKKENIAFKVPLSKIQILNLKKLLTSEENIFIDDIPGENLDIVL